MPRARPPGPSWAGRAQASRAQAGRAQAGRAQASRAQASRAQASRAQAGRAQTGRAALALSLLLGAACKKDDAPAPAATEALGPEAKRRQECERFATDMARTGAIAGQILVTALDDDPASAKRGRAEMKAEAIELRRDLLEKCMQWPEDVMACLPPLGVLQDGCEERLLAALEGTTPPPAHVEAGPSPAWSFTLESDPRTLAVVEDGTVIAVAGVESDELVALRDGAVVWRKEGDFVRWLLPLSGEPATWITAEQNQVLAFDPTTGAERWSAVLPVLDQGNMGDDADDPWAEDHPRHPEVMVAALLGSGLLVGDSEARFFRIDPAWCGAAPTGTPATGSCITAEGHLPDEVLDGEARLFVDGDTRYLWEDGVLRAFAGRSPEAPAAAWHAQMTVRPHDTLSHVSVAGDHLMLIIDDDVVELDPDQCLGETPIAPSGWPQPGALIVAGDEGCEECQAPPPGCRRWRTFLEGVTGEAPARLPDGTVVANAEDYTVALWASGTRWKASTGAAGPLATDGTRVFGFSTELHEGDPPGLFEVGAADGTLRWRTPLPAEPGHSYFSDDIRLAQAGPWLVTAFEQTVVALPLPPA